MAMEVSLKLSVKDPNSAEVRALDSLRIRVLCEWAECCIMSEPLGQATMAWVEEEEGPTNDGEAERKDGGVWHSATFKVSVNPLVSERPKLEAFNKDPGMYAVLLKQVQRVVAVPPDAEGNVDPNAEPTYTPQLVPVGFVYADCSIFLLEVDRPVNADATLANGVVRVSMTVTKETPLIAPEVALPLEPLLLNFQQISGYPLLEEEEEEEEEHAAKMGENLYVYGTMDIGGLSILRKFYVRPTRARGDINRQHGIVNLDTRLCILPGLVDLPRFKEALTSSTYMLEIYHEDVHARAFHSGACEEYHLAASKDAASPMVQAPGAMNAADKVLFRSIAHALTGSSHTQPHGQGPFRLEHLLGSSQDLLKEFAMKRRGKQKGDETVTLREDIISEVRLCRPSKPLRWHTPDDISLRSALFKVKGLQKVPKNKYVKPRHERFDESGTIIMLSTELRRTLKHPKEEPHIMHKPKDMENLTKTFSQARLDSALMLSEEDQRLRDKLTLTPFTRMVFVLKFDDDETLLAINNAISKVNLASLSDIQGSLRSYSFNEHELKGCVDGTLDVITGFMIIDDDMRIAVLEGLAAPGCGMQSVFMDIPRQKENDGTLKILANPEVLYPARLYGEFGPDLKRIRIRNKLKKLARRPELYNRKQVEIKCFDAIDNIMSLRWAPNLLSTKELDLYPPADSLNKVELLYGEAISRSDLDGTAAEAQRLQQLKEKKALMESRRLEESYTDDAAESVKLQSATSIIESPEKRKASRREQEHRCPPTDCWNPTFTSYLASRPEHRVDYLSAQQKLLKEAYEQSLRRMAKREEDTTETITKVLGPEGANAKIYIYGSQAENFMAKALKSLRSRISKETAGATYTFSKDFISQTVCVVDVDADRAAIKAEKSSHYMTSSGFVYPKPKTLQDLITHPKKPSDSRIEALTEEWDGDLPKNLKSNSEEDIANLALERGYTNRIRGGDLFGKLKWPEYKHDFELKKVGNRTELPRGAILVGGQADKDPNASRSVHIGGEDRAKLIEEDEERAKKEWMDKVVVDSLSFQMDGFVTRDKTLQFQRTSDILHGEPNRKVLKYLRTRKSVGGRDFSLAPAPLSITSQGEYLPGAKGLLNRQTDPTKFVQTKEGETKDFVRFIDRNANAPRIMCVLSAHKDITKLSAHEVSGPQWSQNAVGMLPLEKATTTYEDYQARRAQAKANKIAAKNSKE